MPRYYGYTFFNLVFSLLVNCSGVGFKSVFREGGNAISLHFRSRVVADVGSGSRPNLAVQDRDY